jgi:hypothetical protein
VIHPAHDQLQVGSVLLRSGTLTPTSVPLNLRSYCRDWQLIENSSGHVLDQGFRRTGWNLFFLAGSIRGYAVGSGGASSVIRATAKILAKVRSQGFNCAQISEIVVKRFLRIRYVRVEAHSCHLQQGNMLDSLERRNQTIAATAWSIG